VTRVGAKEKRPIFAQNYAKYRVVYLKHSQQCVDERIEVGIGSTFRKVESEETQLKSIQRV